MDRFNLVISLAIVSFSLVGCASGNYNMVNVADVDQQQTGSGYCHKKLAPVGPSDLAKPAQIGGGDYIDYYGPCDGPSMSDRIQTQKRYEQYRFGKEYMDEG